ncbi:hypothetical protein HYALB_00000156 [Hymenoscyphus albidus]|uniref:Geranylgeranyl transferase type-1 subunit beta n=1 Tax=Hymenoscyphus albidus TaxID=595503 RepID=A0A9N9PSC5_9HELO|nr:hypothetical protein HYALB_00000156 [Hymenoscyphus albidus]
MSDSEESHLDIPQHIKYWKRCLLSLLPNAYTSTDSSRMTLAFFILSALDLLSAGPDTFTPAERADVRNWILKCQHPHGGFCGSPNHRYPDAFYGEEGTGGTMDPANLPATYFAISSLGFVGGLERLERRKCLRWLNRLQREDGSFGELVTKEGDIEGGHDMRHCYVLTNIRWMLRGDVEGPVDGIDDIDVEALVGHLRAGQTYDGGISESSSHEAHAGYTYCAIASLAHLKRLPKPDSTSSTDSSDLSPGLTDLPATIRWLVSRQVGFREEDASDDEEQTPRAESPGPSCREEDFVGFNGRCNKNVDTCYAFWVMASLHMLGEGNLKLLDTTAIRRFLFEQTQHRIGGFGKYPGNPPDIYHSYLGLAALAILKEPGLKPLDSVLCVSEEQKEKMIRMRSEASLPTKRYWKHEFCYGIREDHEGFSEKMEESEPVPDYLKIVVGES